MRRLLPIRVALLCSPLLLTASDADAQTPPPAQATPTGTGTSPAPAGTTPATGGAAQGSRPVQSANTLREAQEHIARALQAFNRRDYRAAIREFELANRLSSSADLWFNIAQSYELLNEYESAVDYYLRYLRDKVDPPDRAEVERQITELRRLAEQARAARLRQSAPAGLRFNVTTPGASVYLASVPAGGAPTGERRVGTAPISAVQSVSPGMYQVRVTAPGAQEWRGNVRVRAGDPVTAYVRLAPATEYRTIRAPHIASYILGGLGIAALGTGAGVGIYAFSLPAFTDDARQMPNTVRRDTAGVADIFFGVGAALAITAVIVYFIEAGASRTETVTSTLQSTATLEPGAATATTTTNTTTARPATPATPTPPAARSAP